jgi:predicted DNA binding CopG/RHH family protein
MRDREAMDKEKRITIRVPAELHLAVKIKAAKEDQPVSDVIRALLENWLQEEPIKANPTKQ